MERMRTERQERINSEIIAQAKQAAGITEEVRTWADWYQAGYLVRREEKARPVFKARVYPRYPTKGELWLAEHYGRSQVEPGGVFKARETGNA